MNNKSNGSTSSSGPASQEVKFRRMFSGIPNDISCGNSRLYRRERAGALKRVKYKWKFGSSVLHGCSRQ